MLALSLLAACAPDPVPTRPPRQPRDTDAPEDTSAVADTADDTAQGTPTCGDDTVSGPFEECDGADDASCPGRCSSACACPSLPATGELTLHVIDVGQGDGMLLVTPDGFAGLVDSGDDDHYPVVRDYLEAVGVPALDFTVVSHFHADHLGAMGGMLRDHPEATFAYDSGGRYDSGEYEDYMAEAGPRRTTVVAGDTLDWGPSIAVDVLHAHVGDTDNENNNSVVLRVTYGDVSLMLGGDCESPVCEDALDPGPIDIYKVHHHGSYNGSSGPLLGAMEPTTALVSCGEDNDYGHPHDQTVERLTDMGATVWRTDLDGDLVVRVDGAAWTVNGVTEESPP